MCTDLLQITSLNENCRTAERVSIVNDSEVLVMSVTPDGEYIARYISEWH